MSEFLVGPCTKYRRKPVDVTNAFVFARKRNAVSGIIFYFRVL